MDVLKSLGALVVDVKFPNLSAINNAPSLTVLEYEFKNDLNLYLNTRVGLPVHSLKDLIDFNNAHAQEEMP